MSGKNVYNGKESQLQKCKQAMQTTLNNNNVPQQIKNNTNDIFNDIIKHLNNIGRYPFSVSGKEKGSDNASLTQTVKNVDIDTCNERNKLLEIVAPLYKTANLKIKDKTSNIDKYFYIKNLIEMTLNSIDNTTIDKAESFKNNIKNSINRLDTALQKKLGITSKNLKQREEERKAAEARLKEEAEKAAREQAERVNKERKRLAEEERKAAEARLAEAERLAAEARLRARLAKEAEKARLRAEEAERKRLAEARLAKEKEEVERLAEEARLAKEKEEAERLAKEKAKFNEYNECKRNGFMSKTRSAICRKKRKFKIWKECRKSTNGTCKKNVRNKYKRDNFNKYTKKTQNENALIKNVINSVILKRNNNPEKYCKTRVNAYIKSAKLGILNRRETRKRLHESCDKQNFPTFNNLNRNLIVK